MRDRRERLFFLVTMLIGCLVVDGTAVTLLYRSALSEQQAHLVEIVQHRARMIESLARPERNTLGVRKNNASADATLLQILEAHRDSVRFGETGELLVAKKKGESIVFLLSRRHTKGEAVAPEGAFTEPARRAVSGQSGWMIGRDYRGELTLAAYEAVPAVGWGLVAKIDLSEIRRPYIRAAMLSAVVALLTMLVVVRVLFRFTTPLIRRVESSEASNRAILDTAVDGIIIIDERGLIETFNTAAQAIFGYRVDEVIGRNLNMLMPEPDKSQHDDYLRNYRETGVKKIIGIGREVQGRRKNGEIFPLDLAVSEVVADGHRTFMGIVRDISERKKAEQQLRSTLNSLERLNEQLAHEQEGRVQAEKLSSLGLLAAGVAHEINNPLSGVMACVKSLEIGAMSEDKRREYFGTAREGLTRIQSTVKDLLDYARQRPPERVATDLSEIVAHGLRLIAPAIRKKDLHVVNRHQSKQLAYVDRSQIMQAVMNVLLNAVHASPSGGVITMNMVREPGRLGIQIEDEGKGISEDIIHRVCDPFFTTKQEGEGTGLGLSVTQGILRGHQGELSIKSKVGHGTVVILWLPALEEIHHA
ncbi:MAG: PAS domain S-box protein [Myxococcota bacterium]